MPAYAPPRRGGRRLPPLSREEAERLRRITEQLEERRSAAGDVPGVIAAIPAEVARKLLALRWTVDDSGRWVSPHDGRPGSWQEALDAELRRADAP